jgi:rare lipoprotein A
VTDRLSRISMVLGTCSLLAACASDPRMPEVSLPTGPCTLAPKKATSRPYCIKGVWYHPQQHYEYDEVGVASFYGGGDIFHGRPTATGETFDMNGLTAAHKTLPLPCMAEITNLENGRQICLKVNDRGPFPPGRLLDVSRRVAQLLGFENKGLAKVRVRTLVPESLALNGLTAQTVMYAAAPPSAPIASPVQEVVTPMVVVASKSLSLPADLFKEDSQPIVVGLEAPPPKPSFQTGIFVDVGAHKTLDDARELAQQLSKMTDSPVQPIKSKGENSYVARLGPVLSMSTANQILDQLVEAGHLTSRIVIYR